MKIAVRAGTWAQHREVGVGAGQQRGAPETMPVWPLFNDGYCIEDDLRIEWIQSCEISHGPGWTQLSLLKTCMFTSKFSSAKPKLAQASSVRAAATLGAAFACGFNITV
jgi:hypothetical protein